jgi:hypothetical protein
MWVNIRFFGRDATYQAKYVSDEYLNLKPIEIPEIYNLEILQKEIENGKPKKDYIMFRNMMLTLATNILSIIERALKIIGNVT